VSFKNKSSNATSYLWSFGDSSPHSIEASPSHTFSKAGTYTVTLTSTGPGGQAEVSKTITVLKPLPDLAVSLVRKWSKVTKVHRLASFVVKLRNRGLAADEGVKITIKLPAGAGFTSVSTGGRRCSRALRRVTCSLGTLSAGRVAKLSFVARVVKRANVTVAVSGKRTETSLANNVARVKTR
jgi:PKD repeat protein